MDLLSLLLQLSDRIQNFRIGADNCNLTKIRQSSSLVLIQNNQRGNDIRHPAAEGEQKHDEHRAVAAVDHRHRRKDNG